MLEVEMVVDSVRLNLVNPSRTIWLRQKDRRRYLPITIGGHEADAIAIKLVNLKDDAPMRPLTHDLLLQTIEGLGWQVEKILVRDLSDQVFYADIVLLREEEEKIIDARPSDAIALAVRAAVPIFCSQSVLDRAGLEPEDDPADSPEEPVSEESLKPFAEFIGQLDLDDLGDD